MIDTSEKNFEETIAQSLLSNGYRQRDAKEYDRALCLIPADIFDFIKATQPQEWEKFQQQYGDSAQQKLVQYLTQQVKQRGTLEVFRQGIKINGCTFKLAWFHPASSLNQELHKLYQANIFTLVRQLKYSQKTQHSLDLGIFLNGLPIFTAELKNPLAAQTIEDAIKQYRTNRDEREPLFTIGRCLCHFAVDTDYVYFTTHLQGLKTNFFPFNQGWKLGAGNPPPAFGFATAYLWEQIWLPDSVLNLIQNFVQSIDPPTPLERGLEIDPPTPLERGLEIDPPTPLKRGLENEPDERRLIFPRYHQLDAVRRLVADARIKGTGQRYLIQHSAGSGKSKSISWLAHQLAMLHDAQNQRVFDSVIVVSDRRQIDSQLQRDVWQFNQVAGVVENIDRTSRQLQQALEDGKNIIVTTLQKFSQIVNRVSQLSGTRFAVIIDEAHSSQTGESSKNLKSILSVEKKNRVSKKEDLEDRIYAAATKRGRLPNVSYFAFTATPKPKTLELFGIPQPDGKYIPFSLYTMRQAIEENFILDVLANYTTYKTYFSLLKTISSDPRYDKNKATSLLKWFVDLHPHAIEQKAAIIVEHFAQNVASQINGKAKAMIVTRSRLHAVRYKLAIDHYIKEKGYPYKSLVAFTEKVFDGGIEYTETGMNTAASGKSIPEKATAETFKQDSYRFLIVANKFQTGFDLPLLHTMYVDKKLDGVNAVQTLSRLNRTYPGKHDTIVLDFVNVAEEIQKAFEPYYQQTILSEGTHPHLLYDIQTQLGNFGFYDCSDLDCFAAQYYSTTIENPGFLAVLDAVVERYKEATDTNQFAFREQLKDYLRLYAFLSQVMGFADADLEKLYTFLRYLSRKLPVSRERLPTEIQQHIELEYYHVQQTFRGKIKLEGDAKELEANETISASTFNPENFSPLSQIIQQLNQRFGTDFSDSDKVFIEQLETNLDSNDFLKASVRVNSPEKARLTFNDVARDRIQETISTNFKFYKQFNDYPDFAEFLLTWLFERYRDRCYNQYM